MAFSDTLPVFIYTSFTPWSLSFYPSPLNFFFPSCRLSYFCLPAFTLLLPLVHYSSLPSIRPLILFTGIGLELISAAGCICYRCSALSQQMCINRPSGVVIANKDPVCVCVCRNDEPLPWTLVWEPAPQKPHREGISRPLQAHEKASALR